MSEIQYLDWDSNFFGYKVGKLTVKENDEAPNDEILKSTYALVYIFSENKLSDKFLELTQAKLVDSKIEFIKKADSRLKEQDQTFSIKKVNTISDELLHLVYESGLYSRFKLDENFVSKEFERLYKAWIEKSLSENNSEVLAAYNNNTMAGFISLGMKNGIADIGLIAVDESARGLNIGSGLLVEANAFALKNNSEFLTVVTQENNAVAMRFYEKNGFKIYKKNYIYHLWKKTQ